MKRIAIAAALFGAACVAVGARSADEPKKLDKKEVAKLMGATHRGEKAPYTRVKAELGKETPDWEQVSKDVKYFVAMGDVLKTGAGGDYTSPKGYIDSVAALSKAAGDKDKKAAVDAFTKLTTSCGACHYGGARAMLGKQ
jgi:hypothetical protein